jgi:hypothetical protein
MKCLKKDKIRREGKIRHVMNERKALMEIASAARGEDNNDDVRCPFVVQMHWAFQTVSPFLLI